MAVYPPGSLITPEWVPIGKGHPLPETPGAYTICLAGGWRNEVWVVAEAQFYDHPSDDGSHQIVGFWAEGVFRAIELEPRKGVVRVVAWSKRVGIPLPEGPEFEKRLPPASDVLEESLGIR